MRFNVKVTPLAVLALASHAHGQEVYEPTDYGPTEPTVASCCDPGCEPGCDPCCDDRFYVAGIITNAFGTLSTPTAPSTSDSIFTSGGAIGHSWDLGRGALRLEVEGRQRDPVSGPKAIDGFSVSHSSATGGWSTTVNLWRDYELNDYVSCYIGGGIGAGGYQFGINQENSATDVSVTGLGSVSGFAWQAGGGLACAITDGITLDLGYRFFELGAGGINAQVTSGGVPTGTTNFTSAFSAGELFFAFRIYDPLQGWW